MISRLNSTVTPSAADLRPGVQWEDVLLGVVMSGLVVVTVVGNVLVVVVVARNKSLQTVFNSFIVNLAVTDIVVAVIAMSFFGISETLGRWPFGVVRELFFFHHHNHQLIITDIIKLFCSSCPSVSSSSSSSSSPSSSLAFSFSLSPTSSSPFWSYHCLLLLCILLLSVNVINVSKTTDIRLLFTAHSPEAFQAQLVEKGILGRKRR